MPKFGAGLGCGPEALGLQPGVADSPLSKPCSSSQPHLATMLSSLWTSWCLSINTPFPHTALQLWWRMQLSASSLCPTIACTPLRTGTPRKEMGGGGGVGDCNWSCSTQMHFCICLESNLASAVTADMVQGPREEKGGSVCWR